MRMNYNLLCMLVVTLVSGIADASGGLHKKRPKSLRALVTLLSGVTLASGIADASGGLHKKRPTSFRSPGAHRAKGVIRKFAKGNGKYMTRDFPDDTKLEAEPAPAPEELNEDQLKALRLQAIVISDSGSFVAADELFNWKQPREIQAVRMDGCVHAEPSQFDGGVLSSVEDALTQQQPPPLLLVMGNSKNGVIEDAVRRALANATSDLGEESPLVNAVLPAAKSAILQDPAASFEDLCIMTAELNVWNTITSLLGASKVLRDALESGAIEVHGACLNSDTGKVHFMGEHPETQALLAGRPVPVHTAEDPNVGQTAVQKSQGARRNSGAYFRSNVDYNRGLPLQKYLVNDKAIHLDQSAGLKNKMPQRGSGAYFRCSGARPMQKELWSGKDVQRVETPSLKGQANGQGAYFRSNVDYASGLPMHKELVKGSDAHLDQTAGLEDKTKQRASGAYFRSNASPMEGPRLAHVRSAASHIQAGLVSDEDSQLRQTASLRDEATRRGSGAYFRSNAPPMEGPRLAHVRGTASHIQGGLVSDEDPQLRQTGSLRDKATWRDSGAYFRSNAHPKQGGRVND